MQSTLRPTRFTNPLAPFSSERHSPRVRASQLTCFQGPIGLGGCRESITIDFADAARCVASEIPRKPLPPAMIMGPGVSLLAIVSASPSVHQGSYALDRDPPQELTDCLSSLLG